MTEARDAGAIADILDAAPRQGTPDDVPEGARFVVLSDTLARELARLLRVPDGSWVPGADYFALRAEHDRLRAERDELLVSISNLDRQLATSHDLREVERSSVQALRQALEERSRQFHRAERERTSTFAGSHGSWGGKIYDQWEDCPSHPCSADRKLLAALALPGEDVTKRDLQQVEHEIRTIALVEWGWTSASPRYQALARWASVIRETLEKVEGQRDDYRQRKDDAYEERNKVVAALARLFPSGVARTNIPGWDEEWHGCVYIDLPTGQVSWHFHDSQANLFAGLPPYCGMWDGHDTNEKYRRLAALAPGEAAPQETQK